MSSTKTTPAQRDAVRIIYGGRAELPNYAASYLLEVAEELKALGGMPEGRTINGVREVVNSVRSAQQSSRNREYWDADSQSWEVAPIPAWETTSKRVRDFLATAAGRSEA